MRRHFIHVKQFARNGGNPRNIEGRQGTTIEISEITAEKAGLSTPPCYNDRYHMKLAGNWSPLDRSLSKGVNLLS